MGKCDDLKHAAKHSARKELMEQIEACRTNSATEQAKEECVKAIDKKSFFANAAATDKMAVRDSYVQNELKQGRGDKVLQAFKSCVIDTTSAQTEAESKAACRKEAR